MWQGREVRDHWRLDPHSSIADGWFPFFNPNLAEQIAAVRAATEGAGSDLSDVGIECMTALGDAQGAERLRHLADLGVTHTAVVTMNAGNDTPQAHIEAIKRHWDVVSAFAD